MAHVSGNTARSRSASGEGFPLTVAAAERSPLPAISVNVEGRSTGSPIFGTAALSGPALKGPQTSSAGSSTRITATPFGTPFTRSGSSAKKGAGFHITGAATSFYFSGGQTPFQMVTI